MQILGGFWSLSVRFILRFESIAVMYIFFLIVAAGLSSGTWQLSADGLIGGAYGLRNFSTLASLT